MSQTLKFKKTDPRAIVPTRSTPGAAGYDMCACLEVPVTIYPGETVMIPTGISMEIPLGVAGLIFPRSGMASRRADWPNDLHTRTRATWLSVSPVGLIPRWHFWSAPVRLTCLTWIALASLP